MFKESREGMIKQLINGGYHQSDRNYKKELNGNSAVEKRKTQKQKWKVE